MKKFLFILVILVALIPFSAQAISSFPDFPMSFFGTAKLNGVNLPVGTKIQAYNASSLQGEITLTESGIYGYDHPALAKLVVSKYSSGNLLFKFSPSGSNVILAGDSNLTYDSGFNAGQTQNINLNFVRSSPVINATNTEVVIYNTDVATSTITVPGIITNATLNLSSCASSTSTGTQATIAGAIQIAASTAVGNVNVQIPAATTISGSASWSGIINTPIIKSNSSVTVTPDSGNSASVAAVIEVGFDDVKLSFNKAARILIAGQAGKYAGYSRSGVFQSINAICASDSQSVGDALSVDGDCKIDVGSDLVIWTKHFTKFISYSQTANSGGGGGGGGGGSSSDTVYTPKVKTYIDLGLPTSEDSANSSSSNNPSLTNFIVNKNIKLDKSKNILAIEKKLLQIIDRRLSEKLKGSILLQVENSGQAWYVNPQDLKRYYLGQPEDAFKVMRKLGLGVKHVVIKKSNFSSLLGKILIDTDDKGKAYFINPKNKKAYFLGRPSDAYRVMNDIGIGISNQDIRKIALEN